MTMVLRPISQLTRRLARVVGPGALHDATSAHNTAVRAYADIAQGDAARLTLLTEQVGRIALTIRIGDQDLRDDLLDAGAAIAEWLEAITE